MSDVSSSSECSSACSSEWLSPSRSGRFRTRPGGAASRTPLSHDVLTSVELHTVSDHIRRLTAKTNVAGHRRPSMAIDFELSPLGIDVGLVPLRAFPATWSTWTLDATSRGVGLCLPVDTGGFVGVAVLRSGSAQWFSIDDDGVVFEPVAACRLLDDLCRTRLHLETTPPDQPPDWFWLSRWMSEILAAINDGVATPLDVVAIATAHPAVADDAIGDLDLAGLAGFLVDRHRDHISMADWECIRLDAIDDASHRFHELAEQLELGPFSRWVSAATPSLSEFAEPLLEGCSPLGLRLLGAVLADTLLRDRFAD